MMFFICVLIQGFLILEIMQNDSNTIAKTVQMFYRFGWVGFALVFFFNVGFIVLLIYDTVVGCRKPNRKLMDEVRR
jgi:hypothetical protein